MQRSMMHLFDTWRTVFAQNVLANIERALPPRPQKAGRVATHRPTVTYLFDYSAPYTPLPLPLPCVLMPSRAWPFVA